MCGAMLRVDADLELTFAQKEICAAHRRILTNSWSRKKFYNTLSKIMEIYCSDKYSLSCLH